MTATGPAPYPCASCPYRRDVPSGVWDRQEYEKLPPYDRPTALQPPSAFFCHQNNGHLCAGWCGCHDMADSLGLRVARAFGVLDDTAMEAAIDYVSPVPLFSSGAEAAAHGMDEIEIPGPRARRTVAKLERRRSRRRSNRAT